MTKLHKGISQEEFENGYFYATELKEFAQSLGIKTGSLRKNEIEQHIKSHLFGVDQGELPKNVANRQASGARDKLAADSFVVNYVSDKATKAFLREEIAKRDPQLKDKSGQWYWLNDWRKAQIGANQRITYQDLVDKLFQLMTTPGKLPRIPSTRFNNFITDFLADPANMSATRADAMAAWETLKVMPTQKTYQAYKQSKG
ncbi:hypothetical protein EUZ85_26440 [Hahella sp. KA22]|uniref:SAP domain-containing protein n=1 Tax=Hahella sp. KA22 TaxID=1628392 RepID=UPI000FDD23F5|nr:SAP domain-containing protein [Hahella sp. KA22]AZZ94065.1 hypothetical protein ENC22_23855 [Hahella sp. KA22]QAY57439.1 hypothetical protein EUZ85_26440 [Hahella sp. KA22]